LPKLYEKYKHDNRGGFQILAFPCNQFANEEPGSHDEICHFVQTNYDPNMLSKLHFFEKGDVNGPNEREVYTFLKAVKAGSGSVGPRSKNNNINNNDISWNFEKFLIDHSGNFIRRYEPNVSPMDIDMDINELLNKKEQQQQE